MQRKGFAGLIIYFYVFRENCELNQGRRMVWKSTGQAKIAGHLKVETKVLLLKVGKSRKQNYDVFDPSKKRANHTQDPGIHDLLSRFTDL